MTAISPREAVDRFASEIPPEVIECWNEELMANLRVRGKYASSNCLYSNISKRIQAKLNISSQEVNRRGWLDIEDIFRAKGWEVSSDIPGYNESYSANVTFSSR